MTTWVLGIDGGGTNTRAAIVNDRGELCGVGMSGPSNYDDVGVDTTRENIGRAMEAAREAANLLSAPFSAAFLGLGGVASETDQKVIRGIALDLKLAPAECLGIDHDIRIALAGGLAGRPGIVMIGGTGSSCYGRTANGEHWRAGGWGPLISDEGSGYWLGIQALKAAVQSFDGRSRPTVLMNDVLDELAISDMNDIMHLIYVKGMSRSEIAGLAPLVIRAAQAGDTVARDLIDQGADAMAECVLAVANRLDLTASACELALAGGVFEAGEIVIHPLQQAVIKRIPRCEVKRAELPPVIGACLLALELSGKSLTANALANLRRTVTTL